ncbi:MAG: hypothetical protein ABI210_06430 [Abditibacteriaceae bacterium]
MVGANMIRTLKPQGKVPRAAFTLIKLLVTIAIIALLAAILFPVFARAKGNANLASVTSPSQFIILADADTTVVQCDHFHPFIGALRWNW